MEPDTLPADPVVRAHLKDPGDTSHVMHRYDAAPALAGLVQRFWVPVWSVAPGREAPQRVLQHPVALLVVAHDYARFYGVVPGLSTTTLVGRGWAVGVMCAPAAGWLVARRPMSAFTGRWVNLPEVLGAPGAALVDHVRSVMGPDPGSPEAHGRAMAAFTDVLRAHLPVDDEGELVNRVVARVEADSTVTRVAQVCEAFDLPERALQRLTRRRLGLSPKWLIQRRRLHEAVGHLREGRTSLAEVAALLGYADQPHLTRDFRAVTGTTPREFAARQAPVVSSD